MFIIRQLAVVKLQITHFHCTNSQKFANSYDHIRRTERSTVQSINSVLTNKCFIHSLFFIQAVKKTDLCVINMKNKAS